MFERIDGIIRPWEDLLKIPSGETGRQWVPEAIAWVLELPFDNLIDTFGAKVGKTLAGFVLAVAPQFAGPALAGYAWSARDTEDIHGIAKHLLAEGLDPGPEDLAKIAEAINELRAGFTFGDWTRIARAFGAKSPEEVKVAWDRAVAAWATAFRLPAPPVAPPPAPPPPPPPIPTVPIEVPGFG